MDTLLLRITDNAIFQLLDNSDMADFNQILRHGFSNRRSFGEDLIKQRERGSK
jgi:hypothetical protein